MRRYSIVLAVLLVLSLALASFGCAKPAPAPAPAPKPAPAPAPAPKPHEEVDIEVRSSKFGSAAYAMSVGLAEIVTKNHPWLRAEGVETFGSEDNIKTIGKSAVLRKSALAVATDITYWKALGGTEPFDREYKDLKVVLLMHLMQTGILTANSKITTKEDLVGKKIAMGLGGSSISDMAHYLLDDCWGMAGQYKPQYMGWGDSTKAVADGTVDAVLAFFGRLQDKSVVHSVFMSLFQTRAIYLLGPTAEELARGREITGFPTPHEVVPAGALGDWQKEDFDVWTIVTNWYAYDEMPDEIVYEVVKTAHENYKDMANYHAAGGVWSPETLAWLAVPSEDLIHPGALKYFKEKGLPITIGGAAAGTK